MGSPIRLLLALLCAAPAAPAPSPWEPARAAPGPRLWGDDPRPQPRSPVQVQCQEAQLVVTVHRDLFGTGRLVSAAELSLGPAACRPSRLDPALNTVTFSAGLHECGSTVQVSPAPGPGATQGFPTGAAPGLLQIPGVEGDPGESRPHPGIPMGIPAWSGSRGRAHPGFKGDSR